MAKRIEGEAYYDEGFRDARFETMKALGANPSKTSAIEKQGKMKRTVWIVEYEVECDDRGSGSSRGSIEDEVSRNTFRQEIPNGKPKIKLVN